MRRQLVIGILILLGALSLALLLIVLQPEAEEKPQDELVPLAQVTNLERRTGNLLVTGAGTVQPREELTLAAEVAGKLIYVNPNLREGQFVSKGSVLFRIDTAAYRNAVDIAQADVEAQRVAVLQAREEVALAKEELSRFNRRGAAGADPFASVDESDYAARILPPDILKNSRGAADAGSESSYAGRTNGLATREPQLRSAVAGLNRAQARLVDARKALSDTVVRAPFSGIVRSEQVALGSLVQPGQSLGSIVAISAFEAEIPLSEKDAALIPSLFQGRGSKQVEATVFAEFGGRRYRWLAYVDRVNNVLDPQTRTIDVFLRIPGPINGGALADVPSDRAATAPAAPPLFVGKFVQAEIAGRNVPEYAVLPLSALRPGNKVWLLQGGKLEIRDVEIFQRGDQNVLINTAGLGTNIQVVTSNVNGATNGMKLRAERGNSADTAAKPVAGKKTPAKSKDDADATS